MAPPLIGTEDEGPVVTVVEVWNDDWAAKAAAEGVRDELRFHSGCWEGIRNSIKRRILVVPERSPVDGIGAALGGDRKLSRLTIFSIVQNPVRAHLRDGFAGRKCVTDCAVAAGSISHRDAIDRGFALKWQTTLDREDGSSG